MITFIIFATIFALFFMYYNAVKKHYDSQKQEVPVKQQEPEIEWQRKIQNVSQLAETLVQADIVAMLGQLRHNPFGNGLHFIVGFCAKQISKYGCNPV